MHQNMKFSMTAAALAVLVAAPALAEQTPGYYVNGGVGGTFATDSNAGFGVNKSKLQFNTGYNYEASAGFAYKNGFRVEAEAFHSSSDLDKVSGASNRHGYLSNTDLFLNGYYDYDTKTAFTPYVGAGLGLAISDYKNLGGLRDGSSLKENSVLELAYQGIVGVSAQVDKNWSVSADYRYIGTQDAKVHSTVGHNVEVENQSHNILVGVRYSFDAPETIKPAAVASNPNAPVMTPKGPEYTVFFDFNKSTLTPEAKQILAAAAQDFKQGKYVRIEVTGHTDTVGTEQYNKVLSEKRAAVAKAELKRLGVTSKLIHTVGVGKKDLLVPTAQNVREGKNRRDAVLLVKKPEVAKAAKPDHKAKAHHKKAKATEEKKAPVDAK